MFLMTIYRQNFHTLSGMFEIAYQLNEHVCTYVCRLDPLSQCPFNLLTCVVMGDSHSPLGIALLSEICPVSVKEGQ